MGVRLMVLWVSKNVDPTWEETWLRPEPFAFAIAVSIGTLIRLADRVGNPSEDFFGGAHLFWFCVAVTILLVIFAALLYAVIVWNRETSSGASSGLDTSPVIILAISVVIAAAIISVAQLASRGR